MTCRSGTGVGLWRSVRTVHCPRRSSIATSAHVAWDQKPGGPRSGAEPVSCFMQRHTRLPECIFPLFGQAPRCGCFNARARYSLPTFSPLARSRYHSPPKLLISWPTASPVA